MDKLLRRRSPGSLCSRSLCSDYDDAQFKKLNCHSILDLGCGVGRDFFYLASHGSLSFPWIRPIPALSKPKAWFRMIIALNAACSRVMLYLCRSRMPALTEYTVLGCCTSSCPRIATWSWERSLQRLTGCLETRVCSYWQCWPVILRQVCPMFGCLPGKWPTLKLMA